MTEEKIQGEVLFSPEKARKLLRKMRDRVNEQAGKDIRALNLDESRRWEECRRQGLDKVPIGA
ncbi:MAG: hypothetical protein CO042_01430 [Parcubacteria group bacterium CG_4_9_14_0_2_um_filter_41_8]|nr:MAG: hypothetical protein CO042_01430 [Parcubacteria group bacterium CG_4_9_14_0_2_um_filter_41_8]